MAAGRRVFDAHVHLQPWEHLRPEVRDAMVRGRDDADAIQAFQRDRAAFLAHLDREGIARAVLVNYVSPRVMGFPPEVNDWIAAYARGEPRLVAMGSVLPGTVEDAAAEVRRLHALGIRALKVHPAHQLLYPHDERLAPVYAEAERLGMPVTIHTGTSVFPGAKNRFADPIHADDVAVDHPRLTLILAHAGRPLWYDTAFFLARRHANVRLDLSGIPPAKLLEVLPRLGEVADKCLYGSDWPSPGVKSLRAHWQAFERLALPAQAIEGILWQNAAKVFG
ncbi:MAG TPA: amidohydrolase family protein [Candidatus Thermoplasmatota archaeon]|nr:amidohydrolase family protein [Candidatus Thermoplasmatota archaeon]